MSISAHRAALESAIESLKGQRVELECDGHLDCGDDILPGSIVLVSTCDPVCEVGDFDDHNEWLDVEFCVSTEGGQTGWARLLSLEIGTGKICRNFR